MTLALSLITCAAIACAIACVLVCRTVLATAARDRAGDRATIDMLCQRIQAPTQAVTAHEQAQAEPDPAPVDLDDDDAMFQVREERMNVGR